MLPHLQSQINRHQTKASCGPSWTETASIIDGMSSIKIVHTSEIFMDKAGSNKIVDCAFFLSGQFVLITVWPRNVVACPITFVYNVPWMDALCWL